MDLALAYTLQAQLEEAGQSVDAWQFLALIHAASRAKVHLFNDAVAPERADRGPVARLQADREDRSPRSSIAPTLEAVLLDGFFPIRASTDLPRKSAAPGCRSSACPMRPTRS